MHGSSTSSLSLSKIFFHVFVQSLFGNMYFTSPKKIFPVYLIGPQFLRNSNFDLLFSFPSILFYMEEQNYIQYSTCKWNRFLCDVRILFSVLFTVPFLEIPNIFSSLQFHRIIFSMPESLFLSGKSQFGTYHCACRLIIIFFQIYFSTIIDNEFHLLFHQSVSRYHKLFCNK